MTLYAIGYICIILILNLYVFLSKKITYKQRLIIEICIMLVSAVFIALRPMIMPDTQNYLLAFTQSEEKFPLIKNIGMFQRYAGIEKFFWVIMYYFNIITNNFRIFLIIISVFDIFVSVKVFAALIENKTNLSVEMCLYVTCFGMLYAGISVRAGLGMTLGLLAVYCTKKKKYVISILIIILGMMIQISSALFFVLALIMFLFNKPIQNKGKRVALIISGGLFISLLINIGAIINAIIEKILFYFSAKVGVLAIYESYIGNTIDTTVGMTKIITSFVVFVCVLTIYCCKIETDVFFIVVMLFVQILIIALVGMRAASRVYDMFLIFTIPVMKQIFDSWINKKQILPLFTFYFVQVALFLVSFKNCFLVS